ncbi:hypothetical protein BV22DRAFT_460656 [Leucogyrophana mollusca]|uniref:Uncharacterized protein n=1 Tax=Leucogyrophana mollusca TaxID=85980 RepID=A0ACB8BII3_9AGAM|nr:hypothetical protein BV22DRAFT_460656 [Leucogyrophana mollusca]
MLLRTLVRLPAQVTIPPPAIRQPQYRCVCMSDRQPTSPLFYMPPLPGIVQPPPFIAPGSYDFVREPPSYPTFPPIEWPPALDEPFVPDPPSPSPSLPSLQPQPLPEAEHQASPPPHPAPEISELYYRLENERRRAHKRGQRDNVTSPSGAEQYTIIAPPPSPSRPRVGLHR